jgi:hypothetical protein
MKDSQRNQYSKTDLEMKKQKIRLKMLKRNF